MPPWNFDVNLRYTQARDLSKFDVWLNIVFNIAYIGIGRWDEKVERTLVFPEWNNVQTTIRNSISTPGYQTKSVVWTFRRIFQEYHRREQYASANFVTRVGDVVLGFGSIKSTLHSADYGQNDPIPMETLASESEAPNALATHRDTSADNHPDSRPDTKIPSLSATQLGRRGLDIRLEYIPNGDIFTDLGFFLLVINLLTLTVNHDPKTQKIKRTSLPNYSEDYLFRISAMNDEDDISLEMVITILSSLPQIMYEQRTGGRWAELRGLVKFDGVNIGKVTLLKGAVGNSSTFIGGNGGRPANLTNTLRCADLDGTAIS